MISVPLKVKRRYITQFLNEDGTQRQDEVVFSDDENGYMVVKDDNSVEIAAPSIFYNKQEIGFMAIEKVFLTPESEESDPEVKIEWWGPELDANGEYFDSIRTKPDVLKRERIFVEGEEIITEIPAFTNTESYIPVSYRVTGIDYEITEKQAFILIEFDNVIPVYDKATVETKMEVFSKSCYQLEAAVEKSQFHIGIIGIGF